MNGRIWGVDRHNTYKAMMKKLLSASLFAAVALSVNAYEVNDYAYTPVAKYKITDVNLVKNGTFQGATGVEEWSATADSLPAATTFMMIPGTFNSLQVQTGMNSLSHGIFQKIEVSKGGTYVVSLKVKGASGGFSDLDMTGGNTNYVNAYWNTDGALATVNGTNLYYGTNSNVVNEDGSFGNGVSGGYGFSFNAEDWTEVVFAVDAPANGYLIIDLRGLADGLEIANVECHAAEQVYDDRIARERIAYFNKYLTDEVLAEREYYEDFQLAVADVVEGLEAGKTPEEMSVLMESLEGVWEEFVNENFENMLNLLGGSGNNSANWMDWTSKYNKLSNDYKGTAPWSWSTDRWCHKTAATNSPMSIQWMRGAGANGNWNNIATLTVDLPEGKYYWGVSGQGGMMTLNKNRWARSWANECAETKLFFNGDTITVDTLSAARTLDYVLEFQLEAAVEGLTLGLICNNVSTLSENAGFDVNFYSPVLYKLKEGEYSQEELLYIQKANDQLAELLSRIAVANGYCEAANDTLPWGKEALKAGAEEAQARHDAWAALDTTTILDEWLYNDLNLADTIMNNGVRFLNNDYINAFLAMNAPFSDMLPAIDAAEETLGMRIYSSSSKKADLEAAIAASEAMYAEKLKVAFSTEDSLALVNQRLAMNDLVEQFKLAIDATTIVDINFDGDKEVVKVEDPDGLVDTYWAVEGAKGTMKLSNWADGATGTTSFEFGYNATDSLGMLRLGNGSATVDFTGVPVNAIDIVKVQFDLFAGNLSGKKNGYKVLTAEGDTICGLYYSPYSGGDDINTFGINYGSLPKVGSSSASNAAIAAASNKTTFEIVMDFGLKTMYCMTTSSKGVATSEEVAIPEGKVPAQLVIYTDYNNADRRSWLDNVFVQNIATDPNGIEEVIEVVRPANGLMFNLMGQQILKPVKGQIYIQNGVKKIGK